MSSSMGIHGIGNYNLFNHSHTAADTLVAMDIDLDAIAFPYLRYESWNGLPNWRKKSLQDVMGYTKNTWDYPFTAAIEFLDHTTLTSAEKEAMKRAGFFSSEQWDCFSNHFYNYGWGALEQAGVQQYYLALGWSQSSWSGAINPPSTDNKFWSQLNADQKAAAKKLCFFKQTWDMEDPIANWPANFAPPKPVPTSPPTTAPSQAPTATPSESPTQAPTMEPSSSPTSRPSDAPSASPSDAPTSSPTDAPTASPSSSPTAAPTASPSSAPTELHVEFPYQRYVPYDQLEDSLRGTVTSQLGYNQTTWDQPGEESVEYVRYSHLSEDELKAVAQFGIDDWMQWDCYIHHFVSYEWHELAGFQESWIGLGWNHSSWVGTSYPPATDHKMWGELTQEEQDAATRICFFEQTWNRDLAIPMWTLPFGPPEIIAGPPPPTGAPSQSPSSEPSVLPTVQASSVPSGWPTQAPIPPVSLPTTLPSDDPTNAPTVTPAPTVTAMPSLLPDTAVPTALRGKRVAKKGGAVEESIVQARGGKRQSLNERQLQNEQDLSKTRRRMAS